jgi:hypothetical protein
VPLPSPLYQHAFDSGVYLVGVDTSRLLGRSPVEHGPFGTHPGSATFLIIGQSNAGNHGLGATAASAQVYNFNPFDGLCYPAADPLLGATGDGGSPWCLMADSLIAARFADEILLVPLAVGGAAVAEWSLGGPYHHRLTYALDRLGEHGTVPTHVLWHQGEADALYGTSAEAYVGHFQQLVSALRARGIAAPVYVATATYFGIPQGYGPQQQVIRLAQSRLIDPGAGIRNGPDTDLILDRYDACHLDETGLRKHAAAWVEALTRR